jgi:uncharacterized membrane protein YccF (DUF307 family)
MSRTALSTALRVSAPVLAITAIAALILTGIPAAIAVLATAAANAMSVVGFALGRAATRRADA